MHLLYPIIRPSYNEGLEKYLHVYYEGLVASGYMIVMH